MTSHDLPEKVVQGERSRLFPVLATTSKEGRLNWLLRQVRSEPDDDLHIRLLWPGKSEPTQYRASDLRDNVAICDEGKEHLASHGFHLFLSRQLGGRFTQQQNFVTDLEAIVPEFYGTVGAHLKAWQRPAPKIRPDTLTSEAADPPDDPSLTG